MCLDFIFLQKLFNENNDSSTWSRIDRMVRSEER